MTTVNKCKYLYLDETGDFNFKSHGSRYFIMTSISISRPSNLVKSIDEYKYSCIEDGMDIDYFHCYNDSEAVRNHMFSLIQRNLTEICIDAVIVKKSNLNPDMHRPHRLYAEVLSFLLKISIPKELESKDVEEIVVITDTIPVNTMKSKITKAMQNTLPEMLPQGTRYNLFHHQSRSHFGLQIADYCCWAINRKLNRNQTYWYGLIKPAFRTELEPDLSKMDKFTNLKRMTPPTIPSF